MARSEVYVADTRRDRDGVEVTFAHLAPDSTTLVAFLYDDGSLADAETMERFSPALELDLLRALASYFIVLRALASCFIDVL